MRCFRIRRFIVIIGVWAYLMIVYELFFNKDRLKISIFFPKTLTLVDLRTTVETLNEAQIIYNEEEFGPVLEDTIIIAVQVHDRIKYLHHVIRSLSKVGFIEEALLVFSHDIYDDDINNMVRSINFTKVMQIYYPYSIQLYPNEFPGVDPKDCPKVLYGQTVKPHCENATFYRDAKLAQIKHHWWWKANRIFNQLDCTANHSGMVLFLEDDHFVTPDIIYMMLQFRKTADEVCPQCEVFCFGAFAKINKFHRDINKALVTTWYSKMYNMGFVLNKTIWHSITDLQELFCDHDDYNWDITLLSLSQRRKGGPINILLATEPRVYNFGKCGVHYRRRHCDAIRVLSKLERMLFKAKHLLYPPRIEVNVYGGRHRRGNTFKGGGWQDKRDHELCRNMTKVGRQNKKYQTL